MTDVVSDDEWKTGVLGHFPGLGDITNFTIVSPQDSNVNCLAMVLGYDYWLHPPYDIEETTEYHDEPFQEGDLQIYILDGEFSHIHVCLSATRARSKMGIDYEIEHDREALDGGGYGRLTGHYRCTSA
ncbi:hypothetical protein QBC33DRAFT_515925 [Phialemonium atrogriseum]|uniref:DUF7689 domain-containing protein n=1 Tax=Phialemonium atrogriseum TaxID=1093897 RepID=A0AAJ0FKQ3_9PEZI|nr:uncharacterized protein QBC33DRAFT_515925 [Phialemonium atrogriseum]KAK1766603.1 hypothetical protein QBC33DRAFT_515925 [Phialemonium atrogriseum]